MSLGLCSFMLYVVCFIHSGTAGNTYCQHYLLMLGSLVRHHSVRPPRHHLLHNGVRRLLQCHVRTTPPCQRTPPAAATAAVNQEATGICCIPGLRQPADLQHLVATTSAAVRLKLCDVELSPGALQHCEILVREWEPLVRLLKQHHPLAEWRRAASTAQQQLQQLQGEVAQRAQAAGQQLRLLSVPECPSHLSPEEAAELQQLAAQLVRAFTAVMSDPDCAPRLPVTHQQLADTLDSGVLLSAHLTPCEAAGWPQADSSNTMDDSRQMLGCCLPPQQVLEAADGLVLQLADTYGEPVHLALQHLGLTAPSGPSPPASPSGSGSSSSSGEGPSVAGVLVLTWQTTAAVLALPLHAVPAPLQEAVHRLGVTGRWAALAPVVGWHRHVLATLAPPEAAADRERCAAAAAAWLKDLAGACRSTAAGEVARWCEVTGWQPPRHQQVPADSNDVPVWQLDSLCSSAALADAALAAGESSGGVRKQQQLCGGGAHTTWLEELLPHLAIDKVLQGIAVHLSEQNGLHITVAACSPDSAWCGSTTKCSYVLHVNQPVQSAGTQQRVTAACHQPLGTVLLLVDAACQGLPGTSYVRCPSVQGTTTAAVMLPTSTIDWQATQRQGMVTLQPQTIRLLLHELGHALHFVGAAATPADPVPTGMRLDALEVPSHLAQRAATDPITLKVILTAGGDVPVAMRLCRALAAWTQTCTCSPQHLQQHMAVALADLLVPAGTGWSLLSAVMVDSEHAVQEAMQIALQAVSIRQVQLAGSQLQYLWGLVCFPLGCVAYISATLVAAALDAKAKADKGTLVAALITSSTTETALQAAFKATLEESAFACNGPSTQSMCTMRQHGCDTGYNFAVIDSLPMLHLECYQDVSLWS